MPLSKLLRWIVAEYLYTSSAAERRAAAPKRAAKRAAKR
jgi:hypothetical protein